MKHVTAVYTFDVEDDVTDEEVEEVLANAWVQIEDPERISTSNLASSSTVGELTSFLVSVEDFGELIYQLERFGGLEDPEVEAFIDKITLTPSEEDDE